MPPQPLTALGGSLLPLPQESAPFAVIGSNTVVEAKGQRVRGRLYPWGIVEGELKQGGERWVRRRRLPLSRGLPIIRSCPTVENQAHCDFVKLRNMLIRTHMHDLKDVTCDVHYENYRAHCIQQMTRWAILMELISYPGPGATYTRTLSQSLDNPSILMLAGTSQASPTLLT